MIRRQKKGKIRDDIIYPTVIIVDVSVKLLSVSFYLRNIPYYRTGTHTHLVNIPLGMPTLDGRRQHAMPSKFEY
jgi:hypothetical protein